MILFFENITEKTCQYTISDSCWFPQDTEEFLLTATANIIVTRRDSKTVFLTGRLEGKYSTACDRCREQVKQNLHCEFEYLITTRKEPALELRDVECSDEDAITLYLKEPEVDVNEILREQTYLAMPLRILCSEECKGICIGCGVSLNSEVCCCSLDESSSAFAVLKKLTTS